MWWLDCIFQFLNFLKIRTYEIICVPITVLLLLHQIKLKQSSDVSIHTPQLIHWFESKWKNTNCRRHVRHIWRNHNLFVSFTESQVIPQKKKTVRFSGKTNILWEKNLTLISLAYKSQSSEFFLAKLFFRFEWKLLL